MTLYTERFKTYERSETELYSYNSHFSSITELTKKGKHNDAYFRTKIDQIGVLQERSFMVDRFLLEQYFLLLLKDQNLDDVEDLNRHYECFSSKITKFVEEGDLGGLRFYHSRLSNLLTIIRIKTILEMKFDGVKLFLPFMFCFRGRVYELSDLSFTFYKEFRFCLYTGFYDEEREKFHPINSQINSTVDAQFNLLNKFDWFTKLSIIRKRACVWCFISLGALKKTELGKKVHVSCFVQKGIEIWENRQNLKFNDIYEKIEAIYLNHLIKNLQSPLMLKKWLFWKDAPASCFQHLLLILGPANDESHEICNLNSVDTWYDPYSYLIADFFKTKYENMGENLKTKTSLFLSKERFFEIFSRKRLKKVFMTESYGAGYKKLTSFFVLDLDLKNFTENEKNQIMTYWEELFDYISNKNVLFHQSSKNITKHFEKNKITKIINPDKSEVDFSCFKVEIRQFEIYIDKKRHTLQKRTITTKENKSQFRTSIRANFVHAQDALLARAYIEKTHMWTVHDCFSIDLLNVTFMVAVLNNLINESFYDININNGKKKFLYSFFIIL